MPPASGRDSVLAHIVRLMREAQGSQAPIQRLADRISAVFVPVVMSIAVATFAVWMIVPAEPSLRAALTAAVAVLIIACPCAMGLGGADRGDGGERTRRRRGHADQGRRAARAFGVEVDTVVFDKTGTLTEGAPQVVDFRS